MVEPQKTDRKKYKRPRTRTRTNRKRSSIDTKKRPSTRTRTNRKSGEEIKLKTDMSFVENLDDYSKEDLEIVKKHVIRTLNYGKEAVNDTLESDNTTNQHGGVIYDTVTYESAAHALEFFLINCTVNPLAPSSIAARIIICALNDGVVSPFTSYSARTMTNPQIGDIKQIILKFVLIGNRENVQYDIYDTEIQSIKEINREARRNNQLAILTAI